MSDPYKQNIDDVNEILYWTIRNQWLRQTGLPLRHNRTLDVTVKLACAKKDKVLLKQQTK